MAKFYGSCQGDRGEATRLGHTGLITTAASWDGCIKVELKERDGVIWADVWSDTWHGSGRKQDIYSGPVGALIVPAGVRKEVEIWDKAAD
jgi:hypothetical protein